MRAGLWRSTASPPLSLFSSLSGSLSASHTLTCLHVYFLSHLESVDNLCYLVRVCSVQCRHSKPKIDSSAQNDNCFVYVWLSSLTTFTISHLLDPQDQLMYREDNMQKEQRSGSFVFVAGGGDRSCCRIRSSSCCRGCWAAAVKRLQALPVCSCNPCLASRAKYGFVWFFICAEYAFCYRACDKNAAFKSPIAHDVKFYQQLDIVIININIYDICQLWYNATLLPLVQYINKCINLRKITLIC